MTSAIASGDASVTAVGAAAAGMDTVTLLCGTIPPEYTWFTRWTRSRCGDAWSLTATIALGSEVVTVTAEGETP